MAKNKDKIITIFLIVLMFILIILSILLGTTNISLKDFFAFLFKGEENVIITGFRLPRTIAIILVGAGLSVSGLLLQTMLNNSLASPSIVGINTGAGLGVVVVSVFVPFYSSSLTTLATIIGAFLSSMLIYLIAKVTGASRGKLILAGVAISRLINALIDAILVFNPDSVTTKQNFQMGSFENITFVSLYISGPLIIIGLIGAIILSKYLDILILGDDSAKSLGLNVDLIRFLLILVISILSASSVAIVGLLSFLGLIIPHITKKIFGMESHKKLIIYTILFGISFTLLCDTLTRLIFSPKAVPVGIILSLIGVPFFIYLLFNKGGRRRVVNDHKLER